MHDTMMMTTVVAMMIMPLVMFVMVMAMSVVVRMMISKNYSRCTYTNTFVRFCRSYTCTVTLLNKKNVHTSSHEAT